MDLILCHMLALAIGYVLDLIVGDPPDFPHPVRWIGRLISALDHAFMDRRMTGERAPSRERAAGVALCLVVLTVTGVATATVVIGAYWLCPAFGVAVEACLTCQLLAARSLYDESMKVHAALVGGTLEEARAAVAMIVGRDVARLDREGVTRAAVETVAENASDGVIAPLCYALVGGPILGFLYKAVNTMDSMVGYRNERYENFGTAAARLDDAANYLPSRLSALLMILAAFVSGKDYSGANAFRVFRRDRYNHKSPNSAQTESVCAGALGVRLAGDAWYFGKLARKPYIGDATREIEPRDIPRTCRLMFVAEAICMTLGMTALVVVALVGA